MGKKGFFATLVVLLLLIFLLFPSSTGEERFLIPQRIVNLDSQQDALASGMPGSVSFSLGEYFGYFSPDMELAFWDNRDYRVSISDEAFINYSQFPASLIIQNSLGVERALIDSSGYPVISGNRVAVLSESLICLYDLDGNLFWKKEILSLVTTLSVNDDYVLIGYLDGLCELVDVTGDVLFSYRPGGSRIESVYSAAISGDGQYMAVISGLDPQRFIILQNRKNEFKPVHHFELGYQFRRTVDMYFSSDNTRVFFEDPRGVNVYHIPTQELMSMGEGGRLEHIFVDETDGFYSLLLRQEGSADLKILTPDNKIVLQRSFPGEMFYFSKSGNDYYIGSDDRLMYFQMVCK